MNKQNRATLAQKFGDRVSFHPTEMMMYSHDTASLPSLIKGMFKTVPQSVVQPAGADDVVFITKFARENNIPLTPRGAATSGWGGTLPTRSGIVVDFSSMRRIINIDKVNGRVTVEAGVIWNNLETELEKRGLALRITPSSALSATVGGWVAEGGGGIGSFEYGQIGHNVQSVKIVNPEGEIKVFKDADLELVVEAEGITGMITEVTLLTRPADASIPVVVSFPDLKALFKALDQINEKSLPLWHISFSNASFVNKQEEAKVDAAKIIPHFGEEKLTPKLKYPPEKHARALFVYPAARGKQVRAPLMEIIKNLGGQIIGEEETNDFWNDRFFPIRLKRLGPSLVSSEALVSVPILQLKAVIEEVEAKYPGVAITATMLGKQDVSLLANMLADERAPAYTFEFPKAMDIIDIACKHGGCPYSLGLYFTRYARHNFGTEKVKKILEYKEKTDPKEILNPGKILPENRNPKLLGFTMGLAKLMSPFVGLGRKIFSHKPKLAKKIPTQIAHEAYACAQCGYCINVCDQYFGRQWESESSRGRWYFLRQYLEGKVEFDQMMLDSFLLCTTCQRCNTVCQVQIPIQQMWDQMRGLVITEKGYHTFPGFEMMASAFVRESNIWAGGRKERDSWVPADVTIQPRSKVAYWAGCTASFVEHDIAQNAVHIMKEGGIDFTYLGKDEACCGIPFYSAGKWDLFAEAVKHNINEINKRGIEEIVISCPGCWVTLNHLYREWAPKLGLKYDVKVKHITEVTAELIKEDKLKFKRASKDGGKVTYHDPCHIGRHGGIYEAPREVLKAIPGIQLVEMEHNRADALCCGSVLSRVGRPPAADAIGIYRMKEAQDAGAGVCLTTCPCCEVQLRVGARAGKSPVKVLDFSDVVADALGYDQKDPTHSVLDAWDVFGVAIDMMTINGMTDMMAKMMPEIMAAMPGVMKGMMSMMKNLPAPVRKPMWKMMEKMIPMLMPRLLPGMLPALMPRATELMKEAIPNMPPVMSAMLPEMLPEVMAKIMPPMLPSVAPLIAPKMTAYLEMQAQAKKG